MVQAIWHWVGAWNERRIPKDWRGGLVRWVIGGLLWRLESRIKTPNERRSKSNWSYSSLLRINPYSRYKSDENIHSSLAEDHTRTSEVCALLHGCIHVRPTEAWGSGINFWGCAMYHQSFLVTRMIFLASWNKAAGWISNSVCSFATKLIRAWYFFSVRSHMPLTSH